MTPTRCKTALLALTVLVGNYPSVLRAQKAAEPASTTTTTTTSDSEENKAVKLSPYIVSTAGDKGYYSEQTLMGSRYNKNIHDIPAGVTIINKEFLNDLAAYDILEPVKYAVSGVTLNQPDADDWNIRGFRTRGGFRNGRRSAFGGFASSTWDVERLEIIKGPAAMMTGVNSSAIGGTVNYITAKPTEDYRSWASLQLGEFEEYRAQIQSSGPIAKYDNTKLLYRGTIGHWKRGFDKDFAYWDENFMGGTFQAKFGPETTLTLDYTYMNRDSNVTDNDLTDPVAYAAGRFKLRTDVARARQINLSGPTGSMHLTNEYIELDFSHKFSKYLAMRVGYQNTLEAQDWIYITPQAYATGSIYNAIRTGGYSKLTGKANQFQLDLVGTFEFGDFFKNEVSGGIDYDDADTQQHEFLTWNMPNVDVRNPDFSGDKAVVDAAIKNGLGTGNDRTRRLATTWSYYFQDNLSFWKDRITLIAGFRWLDSFNTTRTVSTGAATSSNPVPLRVFRNGLIIKPMKNVSVYAVDATNFFPSSGAIANPGTPFQYVTPDSNGIIREYGLKFNFLNGKIYGDGAYFDLARTNVRSSRLATFPDGTVRTIEAALDTTTKGWEFNIGSRLDLSAGTIDLIGTYYDALSLTPNNVPAYNAPSYITTGTLKWSFKHGMFKGLSVGGSVRNESTVYMSAVVINQRPMTEAVFANYSYNEHFTVGVNVDNVTDEQYVISGGPIWGDAALGRRVRLSFRYNY